MNLGKLIPSYIWGTLVCANLLFAGGNLVLEQHDFLVVNILSAAGCYLGYRISKWNEG